MMAFVGYCRLRMTLGAVCDPPQVLDIKDMECLWEHISEDDGERGKAGLLKLRQIFSPFVLRRLKTDVLNQLTPKTTIVRAALCYPACLVFQTMWTEVNQLTPKTTIVSRPSSTDSLEFT
jgi:hypothetical protein